MGAKFVLDHRYIAEQYVKPRTANDIGKELGVSSTVIFRHLRESGIAIRNKGYGFKVQPIKELSIKQYEFFDGLMLGDGSICRRNNPERFRNDFLSCAFKYKEFAQYIKDTLELKPKVHKKTHKSTRYKTGECEQWGILSSSNIFFTRERDRWYLGGKKIIPQDCRLTQISWNIFYLGDGYIQKGKRYNDRIYLATQAFETDQLQTLVDHLHNINIKASILKDNQIAISSRNAHDFLSYIGECPVDCYKYKWAIGKE